MTNPSKSLTIFLAFTPLGLLGIDKLYVALFTGNYTVFCVQFVMFILSLLRFIDNDYLSRFGRAFDLLNGLFRYLSLFTLIGTVIFPDIGAEELETYLYPNVTWNEIKGDGLLEAVCWILGVASCCLFVTDFFLLCRSWKNDRNKAQAKKKQNENQNGNQNGINTDEMSDVQKELFKTYGSK
jgi:hypothetical protein